MSKRIHLCQIFLFLVLLTWPLAAQPLRDAAAAANETQKPGLEGSLAAGVLALSEGDYGVADELFDAAAEAAPEDPRPWLGKSRVEEQQGNLLAAIEQTRRAYRLAPQDPDVAMELARQLTRLGTVGEALDLYAKVRGQDPLRAQAYLLPALIYRDVGDDAAAARLLEDAVRAGNAPPRLVEELGLRYLALGHGDRALTLGEKMLELYDDRPLSYLLTGLALSNVGQRSDEARRHLQQAIDLQVPGAGRAHLELGILWLDAEDAGKAMPHLQQASTAMPEMPEVHYRLAAAHRALGDAAAAKEALQRFQALSQQQDDADWQGKEKGAALNAIQALAAQNRLDEAQTQLTELLTRHPEDADAHTLMAKIQFSDGRTEDAAKSIARARELAPQEVEHHFLEGYFAAQRQDTDLARQALGRALAMDDNLAEAHGLMGFLQADDGNSQTAADHFKKALELGLESPDLRRRYAEVLDFLHRGDEAEAQRRAAEAAESQDAP